MLPKIMSIPYGYDLIGNVLIENLHEQKIIRYMQLWREASNLSFAKIAIKLNSLNEPTKRGESIWSGAVVNKILKRQV